MQTYLPTGWSDASVAVYANPPDNTGWLRVDNVSLVARPTGGGRDELLRAGSSGASVAAVSEVLPVVEPVMTTSEPEAATEEVTEEVTPVATDVATEEALPTALPFPTLAPVEPTEVATEIEPADSAAIPDAERPGAADDRADSDAAAAAGAGDDGRRRAGLAGAERLGADGGSRVWRRGVGAGRRGRAARVTCCAGCARWTCGA
ncbi:MAG: hypothetical protein U0703_11895 [Anaerolineae bacterium]